MFVITVNDLDLSIGTFVSFVGCVAATWLRDAPLLGVARSLGCVGVYALIGAVIYLRNLPSIVVTLGHAVRLAGSRNPSPAQAWRQRPTGCTV